MIADNFVDHQFLFPTPNKAPAPIEAFLQITASERASRSLLMHEKIVPEQCAIPVRIGIFFDGTNNNIARDRDGELVKGSGKSAQAERGNEPLEPKLRSHSNIARLFEAYPPIKSYEGMFSYYIPGVGTRFKAIGEYTETSDGKAFAKGGEARIIYALMQVINSVYAVVAERPLFTDDQVGELAKSYKRAARRSESPEFDPSKPHVEFFSKHIDKLKSALEAKPKPAIPSLTLDVFGFSRGAAQAVAFCHFFNDMLLSGRLASIPASVNFLGVFDVVASVGVSFSVGLTTPLFEFSADGHYAWANRILEPLPSSVRAGRHFIAAHEQRMNFPVTTQTGSSEFKQYYFPGVHSDVGGGYGPGEGGKARGGQSDLLSQIPLAYMYKEGILEGVPFRSFSELEDAFKADFEISPKLASAWEAYCRALHVKGEDHGDRLKTHMSLYYRWRKGRFKDFKNTEFYMAASDQSKKDFFEANEEMQNDLEIIYARSKLTGLEGIDASDRRFEEKTARSSQWQILRRNVQLNDWEKWALSIFDKGKELPQEVKSFFDDHVHDSLAGFYLAGEVTDYDKELKVADVMKRNPDRLSGFDKKIYDHVSRVRQAVEKKKQGQELSIVESKLIEDNAAGTPFPLMTDEDTKSMRKFIISTQTSSRREGGGYFLPRFYFPRHWRWLRLQHEFIHQQLLDREAQILRGRTGSARDRLEEVASV
jgi:hypothetical protein